MVFMVEIHFYHLPSHPPYSSLVLSPIYISRPSPIVVWIRKIVPDHQIIFISFFSKEFSATGGLALGCKRLDSSDWIHNSQKGFMKKKKKINVNRLISVCATQKISLRSHLIYPWFTCKWVSFARYTMLYDILY